MTRKELIQNDGYWEALIEVMFWGYKGQPRKLLRKKLAKKVLKLKDELTKELGKTE